MQAEKRIIKENVSLAICYAKGSQRTACGVMRNGAEQKRFITFRQNQNQDFTPQHRYKYKLHTLAPHSDFLAQHTINDQ